MRRKSMKGFSLLEVVIVVAIIAILAAIGIPRMSRGSKGAADSAVYANLSILRNAIDLFAAEHQGTYPTLSTIETQLTGYSNASGTAQSTKDSTHYFGPYLRSIPELPVGPNKGGTGFSSSQISDTSIGWVYDANDGSVVTNTGDLTDDSGKMYREYGL